MSDHARHTAAKYEYIPLPHMTSFRVFELFPGQESDPIAGTLHTCDWLNPLKYDALSYAWGDPTVVSPVHVDGKTIEVTRSLHSGLAQLRWTDRPRFLWADALCINQGDIPERGLQVKQMRRIFENCETVLIWLGPDSEEKDAKTSIDAIAAISESICQELDIPLSNLQSTDDIYQNMIFQNRHRLTAPDKNPLGSAALWKSLIWFYSHSYFTRVWVIQELSANKSRVLHSGHYNIEWVMVELVAGYITMETAFSQSHGFSTTYCWWVSTVGGALVKRPYKWLFLLYLASNFVATDKRDVIYGLRGLMKFRTGGELLDPDYSKSAIGVYRDSVEAALLNFETTDVLLYLAGNEAPSWIPRWDVPMLFRNPFRFGKSLPWKPAGEAKAAWSIDRERFTISLTGFVVDNVRVVEPYNEAYFGNTILKTNEGRKLLNEHWRRILHALEGTHSATPFDKDTLTAVAVSLSYGLNQNTEVEREDILLNNFAAYLGLVLDEESYEKYIPSEVTETSKDADGHAFGKPVWDFKYPESSFIITQTGLIGSCVCAAAAGDVVVAPYGSTYPSVLRHENDYYTVRGYAFVHRVMLGELKESPTKVFEIH